MKQSKQEPERRRILKEVIPGFLSQEGPVDTKSVMNAVRGIGALDLGDPGDRQAADSVLNRLEQQERQQK